MVDRTSRITYMYLTSTYLILGTRGKDYVHTECFSVLMHTRLASLERDRPVRYLPRCACCWVLRPTRHSTNDSAYSMYWCAYCEVRLSVSHHTSIAWIGLLRRCALQYIQHTTVCILHWPTEYQRISESLSMSGASTLSS